MLFSSVLSFESEAGASCFLITSVRFVAVFPRIPPLTIVFVVTCDEAHELGTVETVFVVLDSSNLDFCSALSSGFTFASLVVLTKFCFESSWVASGCGAVAILITVWFIVDFWVLVVSVSGFEPSDGTIRLSLDMSS